MSNAYALRNEDFLTHIDVVCPRCEKHAVVTGSKPNQYSVDDDNDIQCACSHCAFTIRFNDVAKTTIFTNSRGVVVKSHVLSFKSQCDPFFKFSVWYEIPTTYWVLWANNLEHLKVLENFIADKVRS